MAGNINSFLITYLAYAHAVTFDFGICGESASKIKYYVNIIS